MKIWLKIYLIPLTLPYKALPETEDRNFHRVNPPKNIPLLLWKSEILWYMKYLLQQVMFQRKQTFVMRLHHLILCTSKNQLLLFTYLFWLNQFKSKVRMSKWMPVWSPNLTTSLWRRCYVCQSLCVGMSVLRLHSSI